MSKPAEEAPQPGAGVVGALRLFLGAYRTELTLFFVCATVLACFSGPRFLRQSAAPHFIYAGKAWLDGRLDVDPADLPNLEDWACVRESLAGQKLRCEGPPRPGDRWYVSFPSFPVVVMLPFIALHGWQFNDTSFCVLIAAAAIALFYALCRRLAALGESQRTETEDVVLALTLGFGTLFFSCAIRGEVWFFAEVLGVLCTVLYLHAAVGARKPFLAGVLWSMATLTRTPLFFTGLFFVLEACCPGPDRLGQLRAVWRAPAPAMRRLLPFVAGAAPLGLLAGLYNWARFGSVTDFGHRFLYNNRVNADIDAHGLFSLDYLPRNLEAAFLKLPHLQLHPLRLTYDPYGLSLFLTMPFLVLLFFPRRRPRLHWPLWLTVAATALPGFLYQNTGYVQFGFRFSLDWTPYLVLLLAVGGWPFRAFGVRLLLGLGFLVNFWGAVAFRGYTELVRRMGP